MINKLLWSPRLERWHENVSSLPRSGCLVFLQWRRHSSSSSSAGGNIHPPSPGIVKTIWWGRWSCVHIFTHTLHNEQGRQTCTETRAGRWITPNFRGVTSSSVSPKLTAQMFQRQDVEHAAVISMPVLHAAVFIFSPFPGKMLFLSPRLWLRASLEVLSNKFISVSSVCWAQN